MKPMVIRADFTYGSIEFHVASVIFDTRYGEDRGWLRKPLRPYPVYRWVVCPA
jgi:hypothetical protein